MDPNRKDQKALTLPVLPSAVVFPLTFSLCHILLLPPLLLNLKLLVDASSPEFVLPWPAEHHHPTHQRTKFSHFIRIITYMQHTKCYSIITTSLCHHQHTRFGFVFKFKNLDPQFAVTEPQISSIVSICISLLPEGKKIRGSLFDIISNLDFKFQYKNDWLLI